MAASAASSTQDKDPDSGLESTASVSSLSSSVNEQADEPETKRRKLIFYQDLTDGTLKFSSGETLRVNISLLIFKSKVFHQMFKESTPPDHVIEIKDYGLRIFKMFIDCMLELEESDFDKAFALLPIACEYETREFIKRCVEILTPKEKDLKVCRTLNLATSCNCVALEEAIINFLTSTRYLYRLFSKECFYIFLEPKSMLKLLEKIDIDSFIVRAIFNWGNNYLKRNPDGGCSLRSFFDETKISDFLAMTSFETFQSFLDFDKSKVGTGYFTRADITNYVDTSGKSCDNRKVSWLDIKAGDVLVEKLWVKNVVFLADHILYVTARTHPIVFYDVSSRPDEKLFAFDYSYEMLKTKTVQKTVRSIDNDQINRRTYYCQLEICSNLNMISDLRIVIKRTFYVDCRILKGSSKNFEVENNAEDLCLTRSIELKHSEKRK